MGAFVDQLQAHAKRNRLGNLWCHLWAPKVEELHAFAALIGVKRCWFDRDHYDLNPEQRAAAVKAGALEVTSRDIARFRRTKRDRAAREARTIGSDRRREIWNTPKGTCRWCQGPVAKPRRNWCSDECVDEYRIRNDPAFARSQVEKRDKGICALCGRDCHQLEKRIRARAGEHWWDNDHPRLPESARRFRRLLRRLRIPWGSSLWQADHVVPVVEGGGGCGLENLRTACLCCHKRVTRELARRRAEARRGQAQLFPEVQTSARGRYAG